MVSDVDYGSAVCAECDEDFKIGPHTVEIMESSLYTLLLCRKCHEVDTCEVCQSNGRGQ